MELLLHFGKRLIPNSVFRVLQPWYHLALAFLATLVYRFPSRYLTVIGVTGTDGKTTVVHLLHEVLAASGAGVGSLSSLRFKIGDGEEPNFLKMTMPGRFRLQRFLTQCLRAGCRYAVIEVTSQGIAQSRHRFIRFAAAVLTNVTPEHVESHGGFERYRGAKLELFRRLAPDGWAVLNRDDASSELFAAALGRVAWYGRGGIEVGGTRYGVKVKQVFTERMELEIGGHGVAVGLGGAFNVPNALAALACGLALNIPPTAISAGLGRVRGVPGRLEFVVREPFRVVVDYANTPAAYEAVYATLSAADVQTSQRGGRAAAETSKLICVFGAAGGRDRWKRPELGRISSRYCKEIILTSDDPDEEDPRQIVSEIQKGMPRDKSQKTKVILDRREAIRTALADARPGDTVIITGMGAQPWLIVKGKKIPWDDRRIVREELAKLP